MAEESNIYQTPRALAEDILLINRGGGMLTDDENLGLRQVLYWISTFVPDMYLLQIQSARGVADNIDARLWQPLCLELCEAPPVTGPLRAYPKLYAKATLPINLMSMGGQVLLKDIFWGSYQLTPMNIETVRQGGIAYGRFGKERYGFAVEGTTLYTTLPFDANNDRPVSGLGILMPDSSHIIDQPDEPITWLPEWTSTLRERALQLLGYTQQTAPDQVNNGADQQADKR